MGGSTVVNRRWHNIQLSTSYGIIKTQLTTMPEQHNRDSDMNLAELKDLLTKLPTEFEGLGSAMEGNHKELQDKM
jgi:hypothetical protein